MLIKILKSKLHRAKVTEAKVDYPGSIAIDEQLMEAADILPYETVVVADITNGSRLQTYAIPAEPGSATICILGAAAKLIEKNDTIIVFSFVYCSGEEAKSIKPKIIRLDENNRIITADKN